MNSCLSQSIDELWFHKMVGSLVFLWILSFNSFILMSGMNLWRPIIKRKEIIMWIHVYLYWKMNFNSKNGRKRSFLMNPRHQYHLPQREEWIYDAQSLKERRLLRESKFIQIERWTLVLKMVEREVFVTKPKHQYR